VASAAAASKDIQKDREKISFPGCNPARIAFKSGKLKSPPEAEIRAGSLRGKTRHLVQGHRKKMLAPDSSAH
jgi:hypothetical protein